MHLSLYRKPTDYHTTTTGACVHGHPVSNTRTTRARGQPRAQIYCGVQGVGGGPLAKKRVAMLRTEKTMAALLSLGSSSVAVTFCPLILPPKRFEMPYEVPICETVVPDLTATPGAREPTV